MNDSLFIFKIKAIKVSKKISYISVYLTLYSPVTNSVVQSSHLLIFFGSLYCKQNAPTGLTLAQNLL